MQNTNGMYHELRLSTRKYSNYRSENRSVIKKYWNLKTLKLQQTAVMNDNTRISCSFLRSRNELGSGKLQFSRMDRHLLNACLEYELFILPRMLHANERTKRTG